MTSEARPETAAADLILTNATVITVDSEFSRAEALAVKDGKFQAVGTKAEIEALAGKNTNLINLKGATVIPGVNDAHIHASLLGSTIDPVVVDLSNARCKVDIIEALAAKVRTAGPGEWIRGSGLDYSYLAKPQLEPDSMPTRWEIDRISADNPVHFGVAPFHGQRILLLNSRALEMTGINKDTPDPAGGRIVKDQTTGEPTGLLFGAAENLAAGILPEFTREQKRSAVKAAMQRLNSLGITSITEPSLGPGGKGFFGGIWDNEVIHIYNDLCNQGELSLRVSVLLLFTAYGSFQAEPMYAALATTGIHTGFGNEWLRIGGIKLFADGIPPGKTAWMSEDYPGGGKGKLVMPGDDEEERSRQLAEIIAHAHDLGYQVGIHATGDRAIEACVDSFIQAETENPKRLRHYIIHGDFVKAELGHRMAEHEIGVSVQPALAAAFAGFMSFVVGKERAQRQLPLKALMDSGVRVAGGSDAPVVYPDWRKGIQAAVLREAEYSGELFGGEQRVMVAEALRMYTLEGAYQDHMEQFKGSIEPGKLADFCVLEQDITRVDPHEIKDIRVLMTCINGKVVYDAGI